MFDRSRFDNSDLNDKDERHYNGKVAASEYKRANPRSYGASARFGASGYSPDGPPEGSVPPKTLTYQSFRQSNHRSDRSGSNSADR